MIFFYFKSHPPIDLFSNTLTFVVEIFYVFFMKYLSEQLYIDAREGRVVAAMFFLFVSLEYGRLAPT